MSFQAMAWATKQKVGGVTGKAILLMLANYADRDGSCIPGQETLAEECECSSRAVREWLSRFEKMGLIRRETRRRDNGYRTSDRIVLTMSEHIVNSPAGNSRENGSPENGSPENGSDLTGSRFRANRTYQGNQSDLSSKRTSAEAKREFDRFWDLYPHKVGKGIAPAKFEIARRETSFEEIMAGVRRYIDTKRPDIPWCNPSTWLNQKRWLDEPTQTSVLRVVQGQYQRPETIDEILARRKHERDEREQCEAGAR